jgi:hypothetical protein
MTLQTATKLKIKTEMYAYVDTESNLLYSSNKDFHKPEASSTTITFSI